MTSPTQQARRRRARRIAGRLVAALGLAALAACANAVAPAPPVSGYGFGNLSGVDSAAFGLRTRTPGFTFDRGGSGAGA